MFSWWPDSPRMIQAPLAARAHFVAVGGKFGARAVQEHSPAGRDWLAAENWMAALPPARLEGQQEEYWLWRDAVQRPAPAGGNFAAQHGALI